MITVALESDLQLVEYLFKTREVWEEVSRDPYTPELLPELGPLVDRGVIIPLRVELDGEYGGTLVLIREADRLVLHTLLQPSCRGKNTPVCFRALIDWVKQNLDETEIFTYAYRDKPHVLWMARKVGFTRLDNFDSKTDPIWFSYPL